MGVEQIGIISIAGMVFTLLVSFGVPLLLLWLIRRKTKADITSFFIGTVTFIVFALILEQILHTIVKFTTGEIISGNIWLYGLYGGLAAGLFEETGRLVAMRFFMKKNLNLPNALMYGAGHGGAEAILLVGMTSVNNIIVSFMINTGIFQKSLEALDEAVRADAVNQLSALWTLPGYQFFMGGVERLAAIVLHIALSVIVYQSIKNNKKVYWIMAVVMHAAVDFAAVISVSYLNIVTTEVVVALISAVSVAAAVIICRRNREINQA